VLSLSQAAPLVRLRAAAMQEAVPVGAGAMAAILGMDAAGVRAGCAQAVASFGEGSPEVAEAVNFNDPSQTVIAGTRAGGDKACEILKAAGAKRALPLPVSAPFHSSLMKPAAEKLRAALADVVFAPPNVPVVNNVDVAVVSDPAAIRDALYRQAFGAVRWVECVHALKARGVTHIVESGPGKVLAGLTKRIDSELVGMALYDMATLAETRELLA
jgi:[acyl-carrier-protein] S-malonyltransferase